MQIRNIKEIILKFIKGNSSPLENKSMGQWLDHLEKQPLPHSRQNLEKIQHDMWRHISLSIQGDQRKISPLTLRLWRYIAGVAAVLIVGFITYEYVKSDAIEYMTTSGEAKWIKLPDGSEIYLEENSKISIPDGFTSDTLRKVVLLDGKVYFDVRRDTLRPFVIQGTVMQTQVLGTSFTVNAYAKQPVWSIKVNTGKVRVFQKQNDREYILYPQDSLSYQNAMGNISLSAANIRNVSSQQTRLVFKDENLQQVADKLAKWYGVKVHIDPGVIGTHQFSGEFEREDDIEALLSIICLATGTSYERQADNEYAIIRK